MIYVVRTLLQSEWYESRPINCISCIYLRDVVQLLTQDKNQNAFPTAVLIITRDARY